MRKGWKNNATRHCSHLYQHKYCNHLWSIGILRQRVSIHNGTNRAKLAHIQRKGVNKMPRLYINVTEKQLEKINIISDAIGGDAFGRRSAVLRKLVLNGLEAYEKRLLETGRLIGLNTADILTQMRKDVDDGEGRMDTDGGQDSRETPSTAL